MTPPEWDIKQEINWQASTVNSILEYIVYFYDDVKIELAGPWGGVISIFLVLQIEALSTLTNKEICDGKFQNGFLLNKLFDWVNGEQEWYWQVSTVNSILEYIVYFYAFVKEELCYKSYNQNITLPEWVIEQERYWKVSTVNSILEFIVYDTSWMGY